MEGLLEWLINGVYVVYDLLCVPFCGIFTLNELLLSSSSEDWVSDAVAVGASGVADCLDKVWPVGCRLFVFREDVFRYGLMLI